MLASTLTDVGALLVSLSVLITAGSTAFVLIRSAARTEAKINAVHDEVRTGNGQTLGKLADIAEGRAGQAIPEADRTPSEQHHVEMKEATDAAGVAAPEA